MGSCAGSTGATDPTETHLRQCLRALCRDGPGQRLVLHRRRWPERWVCVELLVGMREMCYVSSVVVFLLLRGRVRDPARGRPTVAVRSWSRHGHSPARYLQWALVLQVPRGLSLVLLLRVMTPLAPATLLSAVTELGPYNVLISCLLEVRC